MCGQGLVLLLSLVRKSLAATKVCPQNPMKNTSSRDGQRKQVARKTTSPLTGSSYNLNSSSANRNYNKSIVHQSNRLSKRMNRIKPPKPNPICESTSTCCKIFEQIVNFFGRKLWNIFRSNTVSLAIDFPVATFVGFRNSNENVAKSEWAWQRHICSVQKVFIQAVEIVDWTLWQTIYRAFTYYGKVLEYNLNCGDKSGHQ